MRAWEVRRWLAVVVVGVAVALVIAVPTGIIDSPFYTRMTPVLWWNYPVWLVTAALSGLIAATYVAPRVARPTQQKKAFAGGALSFLAVGCPICNKLVVLALGVSGALSYFAPLQPVLAVGSLALLAEALRRRLRAERQCPTATRPSTAAQQSTGISLSHRDGSVEN